MFHGLECIFHAVERIFQPVECTFQLVEYKTLPTADRLYAIVYSVIMYALHNCLLSLMLSGRGTYWAKAYWDRLWKITNSYSESLTINTNLPMKQNEEIFRERLRQSRGFPNRVCETNNILTLKTREKQ